MIMMQEYRFKNTSPTFRRQRGLLSIVVTSRAFLLRKKYLNLLRDEDVYK